MKGRAWDVYIVIEGNLWDVLETLLGTRSFTEGNVEGHRGTMIFYQGSFAKMPMFEGHEYFFDRQQVGLP